MTNSLIRLEDLPPPDSTVALTAADGERTAAAIEAPLTVAELGQIVESIDTTTAGKRDRAILLVGYASAMRPGEISALSIDDILRKPTGALLAIRRSKTDQEVRNPRLVVVGRVVIATLVATVRGGVRSRPDLAPGEETKMSELTVRIAGKTVGRDEVQAWENKRIDAAAKKIGLKAPSDRGVPARREAFLAQKLELGSEEIMRRLRRDIRAADLIGRMQARLSSRRRISRIDVEAPGGEAAEFADFFETATATSDEPAMLRACPDHFVIRMGPGGQEVLETNGGSPLAAFFTIDYDDVSSLVTAPDPAFPFQIAGVARASDGTAIGGVRHQIRDTDSGFQARLTVEFPLPTLPNMVSGHRWHLACEFSNWVEAALAR